MAPVTRFGRENFGRVTAKFVPLMVRIKKEDRASTYIDLLCRAQADPNFIKRVINETWVYGYAVERKVNALQFGQTILTRVQEDTIEQILY